MSSSGSSLVRQRLDWDKPRGFAGGVEAEHDIGEGGKRVEREYQVTIE